MSSTDRFPGQSEGRLGVGAASRPPEGDGVQYILLLLVAVQQEAHLGIVRVQDERHTCLVTSKNRNKKLDLNITHRHHQSTR